MSLIKMLFGVPVRFERGRYYRDDPRKADLGLAESISRASHSMLSGSQWQRVMRSPVGSHVICNQKRADARRDARMARRVVKARFT